MRQLASHPLGTSYTDQQLKISLHAAINETSLMTRDLFKRWRSLSYAEVLSELELDGFFTVMQTFNGPKLPGSDEADPG